MCVSLQNHQKCTRIHHSYNHYWHYETYLSFPVPSTSASAIYEFGKFLGVAIKQNSNVLVPEVCLLMRTFPPNFYVWKYLVRAHQKYQKPKIFCTLYYNTCIWSLEVFLEKFGNTKKWPKHFSVEPDLESLKIVSIINFFFIQTKELLFLEILSNYIESLGKGNSNFHKPELAFF